MATKDEIKKKINEKIFTDDEKNELNALVDSIKEIKGYSDDYQKTLENINKL